MAKEDKAKDEDSLRKLVEEAHFRIDELERKLKGYDEIAKLVKDIASVLKRIFEKPDARTDER